MSGWVVTTGSGSYKACWRNPEGKQVSKTFPKGQKREAQLFADKQSVAMAEGTYTDPARGRITLGEYWSKYFLPNAERRATTLDRYERHYRLYIEPEFGHRRLNAITPEQVKAWKVAVGEVTGKSTVASALRLLKTILNAAVDDDRIARSPARSVKNPSTDPKGGVRVLEAEEFATLAESMEPRYRALVFLLGYRGLRIGEAAALRVGDLDAMRSRLSVSKTLADVAGQLVEGPPKTEAGIRTITLPAFLRDMLTAHVAEFSDPSDRTAYLFPSPGGGPGRKEGEGGPLRVNNWRRRDFARAVETTLKSVKGRDREGLLASLTPHDLRDTAATLAFQAGATVKEVSVMLGHSNPSVTLRIYTGVLDSMSERTDDALDATFRATSPAPRAKKAAVVSIAR